MPAAERAPAFQCYADDHLADSAELSNEEFGQYWKLALYAWREMGLPSDHGRIAKVLGISQKQFDAAWPTIGAKFELNASTNRYVLPWQEDERQKQADNRVKRRNAANARWGKTLDGAGAEQMESTDDARALEMESSTNSPLPTVGQSTTTTSGLSPAEVERRIGLLSRNSKVAKIAVLLPADSDRRFFYIFLVRATVTGEERADFWLATFNDWLNPQSAGNLRATPAILAQAVCEYGMNGFLDDGFQPTARHFRAFVIYVRDGVERPVRVGSKAWKPGANVKQQQALDTSGNKSAADRLTRELDA